MKNADLRRDDELVGPGQRRTLYHSFRRENLDTFRIHVARRHRLENARRATALRVDQEFRLRVKASLKPDVLRIDAGVHMTLAHPHVDVLATRHPTYVRAQEHVGKKEN